ncbi:MAG: hypothetical protein AB7N76_06140 [Planctomycetota bacterium]
MEWLVALRDRPDRPVVRVCFRRPWYLLGLIGSVALEALDAAEGEAWCGVVRRQLETEPLLAGGKVIAPPHTRSAARVQAALEALPQSVPALVAWRSGAPAPPPQALARPDLPEGTRAALLDAVGIALAVARSRGWGGPPLDDFALRQTFRKAEDEAALLAAAAGLAAAAAERSALQEALAEKVLPALAPQEDDLAGRLREVLAGATPAAGDA